ncbi:MAG: L,D-transpeptidase [Bacteroidota bacterium]
MEKIQLDVKLDGNRNKTGTLILKINGKIVKRYKVLGRGSRGKGDTSMLKNGNTPTGEYSGNYIVDTTSWNQNSYGPNGAIRLNPTGGRALLAKQKGRSGLLIHGGKLGGQKYWRGKGQLRATHGCLRLQNEDIKNLINQINQIRYNEAQQMCVNTQVKIIVSEQ